MNASVISYQLPPAPEPRAMVRLSAEVAPGIVREVEIPGEMLERWVAVKFVPVPGKPGLFRPNVRIYAPLVQVTDDIGERLGWGLERRQVLALAIAGFIKGYRATTGCTLVDPVSVWEHLDATDVQVDGEGGSAASRLWTPECVRHYSDARDFVKASGIVPQSRRDAAKEVPHLEFDFGEPLEPSTKAA